MTKRPTQIERRQNLINNLWSEEELKSIDVWNRKQEKGFTTIPRTLVIIGNIMDSLSSGKPLSQTYFTLWCHAFDDGLVTVKSEIQFANESGFQGGRAVSTWKTRMRLLKEKGFISPKEGNYGEFSNLLIVNPYNAITSLTSKENIQEKLLNAFWERLNETGSQFKRTA